MSNYTKLLQFDKDTALDIAYRDKKCFFCKHHYHMESKSEFDYQIQDIMHVVNKSKLGLGVHENGVLGCRYHHHILDNGNKGLREEMINMLKEYMSSLYPGWTEESVTYSKWSNLTYKK